MNGVLWSVNSLIPNDLQLTKIFRRLRLEGQALKRARAGARAATPYSFPLPEVWAGPRSCSHEVPRPIPHRDMRQLAANFASPHPWAARDIDRPRGPAIIAPIGSFGPRWCLGR
jgi:hypothetical protein